MKTFEIVRKRPLNGVTDEFTVYAPLVTRHCLGGQFVIVRASENGERLPFTIADYDRQRGTVTIVVQAVGMSTMLMSRMNAGDCFADVVGPLGKATDLDGYNNILLVGGGIGSAVVYPQTRALTEAGKSFTAIIGGRTAELVLYREEFLKRCANLIVVTDDGSIGQKGFVTESLKLLLEGGGYDLVFAVGPLGMMKAVCDLTRGYNIRTIVSMNSLMVDGTGMCGCCRLTVGGVTKYACVDGPEFDGHLVDFDEAISRSKIYAEWEREHVCRLTGERR